MTGVVVASGGSGPSGSGASPDGRVPSRADTEATLCRIFADVLGLDLVRPDDAFFDVGGDSVLALGVIARAREAGLPLSVRDLFDRQTPAALATVTGAAPDVADAGGGAARGDAVAVEPPLLALSADELAEFEELEDTDTDTDTDIDIDQRAGGAEAGREAGWAEAEWETVT
jgi:hypothetical protein